MRVVNLDCLTYAGNPDNLARPRGRPRYRFVHGDIADRRRGRPGDDRVPGGRPLRGREPRRPLDRGRGAVRADQRRRHAVLLDAAREREVAAVRPGLDRRGLRQPRPTTGCVHRVDAAGSQQPVRRQQGGRRPARRATSTPSACDACITRCSNNYGPYQFPEKLIPLFVTNLHRGQAGPGLRRRPERSATGCTSTTTAQAI